MNTKEHFLEHTTYVEPNELVYNRLSGQSMSKRSIKKLKIGSEVFFKRDKLIWWGEITKMCGDVGFDVYVY